MADTAAQLVDHVFPIVPARQGAGNGPAAAIGKMGNKPVVIGPCRSVLGRCGIRNCPHNPKVRASSLS
jgi:hypothetical protein